MVYCLDILPCVDQLRTREAISVFVLIRFAPAAKLQETICATADLLTIQDYVAAVIYGSEVSPPPDDVSIPSCFTLHSGCSDLHKEDSLSSFSSLMNAEVFHCVRLTAHRSHCVIVLGGFVSAASDLMSLAPQGANG